MPVLESFRKALSRKKMASSSKNEVVTNEVDDDEEEDYMSDAFLAKCVQEDVRPGLKMVKVS